MTAPRKNTDFVNAPVLFRLPNLHADHPITEPQFAAADSVPGRVDQPRDSYRNERDSYRNERDSYRNEREPGENADRAETPHRQMPLPPSPQRGGHSGEPFAGRLSSFSSGAAADSHDAAARAGATQATASAQREIFAKRSVILLAMTLIACLAWFAGRHNAREHTPNSGIPIEIAAQTPLSSSLAVGATDAAKAAKPAPEPAPAKPPVSGPARPAEPLAAETSDFYLADDLQLTANGSPQSRAKTTNPAPSAASEDNAASSSSDSQRVADEAIDPSAIFAGLSFGALTPPANQPRAGDDANSQLPDLPLETAPTTSAAKAPVAGGEPASGNPPAQAAVTSEAAPPAADLSAAPDAVDAANPADSDPNATAMSESTTPSFRRVLSPTPNDIPDWSRYFPGGNGSVQAASANGVVQQVGGSTPAASRQASLLDDDARY